MMTCRLLLASSVLFSSAAARAAGDPAPDAEDKVHPARYRIRVEYDKRTVADVRREIEEEIDKALAARRRRLHLSEEEVEELRARERERYEAELEAIETARRAEEAARRRGDSAEAERQRDIRLKHIQRALDLARRARLIEQALLAAALRDWRLARRRERQIAERALRRLQAALERGHAEEQAELRRRGPRVPAPPHR
jgi:hypothetical protein